MRMASQPMKKAAFLRQAAQVMLNAALDNYLSERAKTWTPNFQCSVKIITIADEKKAVEALKLVVSGEQRFLEDSDRVILKNEVLRTILRKLIQQKYLDPLVPNRISTADEFIDAFAETGMSPIPR